MKSLTLMLVMLLASAAEAAPEECLSHDDPRGPMALAAHDHPPPQETRRPIPHPSYSSQDGCS